MEWSSAYAGGCHLASQLHIKHVSLLYKYMYFSIKKHMEIRVAMKKFIEWRLQVQIAFLAEVNLAPSRPE
jgi:hypothetical protein